MRAGESNAMLAAALDYIARGWAPIPVPHRQKGPVIDGWQHLRITAETAPGYFNGGGQGLGVIVGKASGGLTDLDLDCPEAIAAAPYILPRTAVFGHASKPLSHWVYRTNLCETLDRAAIKFMGSDKTGLIEVRMGAGGMAAQTIFPPSTHISGEPIEWADGGPGKIAEVDGDELIQFARRLAAAAELARSYPKIGGRHDAAFVLGGFLARCGFSQPGAATFVEAVAAASLQPGDKRRDMARTARDGAAAGKLAGFPLLAETFGEGAAKKVADWLDYAGEREGRGARAAKGVEKNDPNPDSGLIGPDPADAELERLAKLSPLKYERERKAAAEALGLRASLLDRLVAAKRTEMGLDGANGKQGRPIEFPEPELWPYEVDGAALIEALAAALAKHIVMSVHQAVAAALWVVHAYLIDRSMISPRLAIRSAVKGSGKTTCLDVLARLVPRPLSAANVSPAAIFRVIAAHAPTLLIDEADTLFGEYGDENLRGVLNAGHRQGGTVLRVVGEELEPRAFSCYAATVIALIGQLPGTLADRSIDIVLARRRPSESITAFRLDRTEHLDELARQIARWAKDNRERIGHDDPVLPAGLYNRAADNWRPLLAIAEAVGAEWPEKARSAAAALAGGADDEASWTELLLSDIRDIFAALKDDELIPSTELIEIKSATLIEQLMRDRPAPWAEYGKSGKPITPEQTR